MASLLLFCLVHRYSTWFGGLLVLASIGVRWLALSQTPYANGWDGYFYLIQLKSWVEKGVMHTREASLIYPFLRGVQFVVGDYVAAFKWTAALLAGGFTAVTFWLGKRLFPDLPFVALVVAAWTVFSPQLTYFAAQYPKNLLGAVLFGALVAVLSASTLSYREWVLAAVLLLLGAVGHRLTFAVAMGYSLLWALQRKKRFAFSGKALRIFFGFALLLLFMLSTLPGLLHWSDWGRLGHWLPTTAHFAPISFWQTFGGERLSKLWQVELTFVCIAFGVLIVQCFWHSDRRLGQGHSAACPLVGVGVLLLWPFLEWSLTSLAYRMWLLFALLGPWWVGFAFFQKKWPTWAYVVVVGGLLLASVSAWRSYAPQRYDPDYRLFDWVTGRTHTVLPTDTELVIAPNALAEYFTFSTGIDALPWLPEYALAPDRCWRLATNVRWETVRYYTGDSAVVHRVGPYTLLREVDWQRALQVAHVEADTAFLMAATQWPNPARIRPTYLLRRKR